MFKKIFGDCFNIIRKIFIIKDGFIGDYDYVFFFWLNFFFMVKFDKVLLFFGFNDCMFVVFVLIFGFQYVFVMLVGIIIFLIIMFGVGGVNFIIE